MKPKSAAQRGLNRLEIGVTTNEYVTLLLHCAVLEEVISALAFHNKWLQNHQHQVKETPALMIHSASKEKHQRQKIIRKHHSCTK